jgi:hypothetical protein
MCCVPDSAALHASITALTDEQATQALIIVADHENLLESAASWTEATLREALADPKLSEYTPAETATASDGEVARAALAHAATISPTRGDIIARAVKHVTGSAERFEPTTLLIGAIAVALLQTEIKVEKNARGEWSFLIHKKPMRDSTLGHVLTALMSHFTGPGND